MSNKIMVTGSINGKIAELHLLIRRTHEKQLKIDGQGLACCIVGGELFDSSPWFENAKALQSFEFPVPTYFTTHRRKFPNDVNGLIKREGNELHPNLIYIASGTIVNTIHGVSIGSFGEIHANELNYDEPDPDPRDVVFALKTAMETRGKYLDILLTPSAWPKGIVSSNIPMSEVRQSDHVRELAKTCKPRYVFSAALDKEEFRKNYYENVSTNKEARYRRCYFYSLAGRGNFETNAKKNCLIVYNPNSPDDTEKPKNMAPAPWSHGNITSTVASGSNDSNQTARSAAFKENRNKEAKANQRLPPKKRTYQFMDSREERAKKQKPSQECFFCLGNDTAQNHMAFCVADEIYVTIAKGPLVESNAYGNNLPTHLLMIPQAHIHAPSAITKPAARAKLAAEFTSHRNMLTQMVGSTPAALGSVTWQLCRPNLQHLHQQFMGVPSNLITSGKIEEAFRAEARNQELGEFEVIAEAEPATAETKEGNEDKTDDKANDETDIKADDETDKNGNSKADVKAEKNDDATDTFTVWIRGEGKPEKKFQLRIAPGSKFPPQFGREALAGVLGVRHRERWQMCKQTKEEEEIDAATAFEAFEAIKEEIKKSAPQ